MYTLWGGCILLCNYDDFRNIDILLPMPSALGRVLKTESTSWREVESICGYREVFRSPCAQGLVGVEDLAPHSWVEAEEVLQDVTPGIVGINSARPPDGTGDTGASNGAVLGSMVCCYWSGGESGCKDHDWG
jgi:hypothetical protein